MFHLCWLVLKNMADILVCATAILSVFTDDVPTSHMRVCLNKIYFILYILTIHQQQNSWTVQQTKLLLVHYYSTRELWWAFSLCPLYLLVCYKCRFSIFINISLLYFIKQKQTNKCFVCTVCKVFKKTLVLLVLLMY